MRPGGGSDISSGHERRVRSPARRRAPLRIKTHALATRVLFEGKRAVGVEYIDKAHVYRADPAAGAETPDPASLPRADDPDLDAVVDGVKFVRALNERLKSLALIVKEEVPGAAP